MDPPQRMTTMFDHTYASNEFQPLGNCCLPAVCFWWTMLSQLRLHCMYTKNSTHESRALCCTCVGTRPPAGQVTTPGQNGQNVRQDEQRQDHSCHRSSKQQDLDSYGGERCSWWTVQCVCGQAPLSIWLIIMLIGSISSFHLSTKAGSWKLLRLWGVVLRITQTNENRQETTGSARVIMMVPPAGHGLHPGGAPAAGHPWPPAPLLHQPGCAAAPGPQELRDEEGWFGQVSMATSEPLPAASSSDTDSDSEYVFYPKGNCLKC